MYRYLIVLSLHTTSLFSGEFVFKGKHFFATYLHCNLRALTDLKNLIDSMNEAVQQSGATILDHLPYVFEPNGLTLVYLLSESHASIHTYPEYGACFVDLFTCGDTCSAHKFDDALRQYLQPKLVNAHFYERTDEVKEIPYP